MEEVSASQTSRWSRCFRLKHQRLLLSSKWEDLRTAPLLPRAPAHSKWRACPDSLGPVWPLARSRLPCRETLLCRPRRPYLKALGLKRLGTCNARFCPCWGAITTPCVGCTSLHCLLPECQADPHCSTTWRSASGWSCPCQGVPGSPLPESDLSEVRAPWTWGGWLLGGLQVTSLFAQRPPPPPCLAGPLHLGLPCHTHCSDAPA